MHVETQVALKCTPHDCCDRLILGANLSSVVTNTHAAPDTIRLSLDNLATVKELGNIEDV